MFTEKMKKRIPNKAVIGMGMALGCLCFGGMAQSQDDSAGVAPATGSSEPRSLGRSVYYRANEIFDAAQVVHYEHVHKPADEQVVYRDPNSCEAVNDCSGFVSYVLEKVAPKHYQQVVGCEPRAPYPRAKTFAEFFEGLQPGEAQSGWKRISDFKDLHQGDIIAWRKETAPDATSKNTGHVMIVASRPDQISEERLSDGKRVRTVSIPVIDSSSVDHFPPESLPPHSHQQHRDGIGKGTVRLILDRNDQVIGYWEGTYWGEGQKTIQRPSYSDTIAFARLVPFHKE